MTILARVERRRDHLADELAARGHEEVHLSLSVQDQPRVEDDLADMRSPSSVPPGSRMTTGSCELSHSPSISTWVVLPDPSVPSKVMKRPRLALIEREV